MIKLNRKIEKTCSCPASKSSIIYYTPNIMDKVLEPDEEFVNGKKIQVNNVKRDVSVLFNQERLKGYNIEFILDYFKSHDNDQLAELRSKCSDEQLISLCKSRFIQSPAELQSYFDYLEQSFDAEVRRLIPAITSVEDSTSPNVVTTE